MFWASEGTIALGYPEASKRGRYMKYVIELDRSLPELTFLKHLASISYRGTAYWWSHRPCSEQVFAPII